MARVTEQGNIQATKQGTGWPRASKPGGSDQRVAAQAAAASGVKPRGRRDRGHLDNPLRVQTYRHVMHLHLSSVTVNEYFLRYLKKWFAKRNIFQLRYVSCYNIVLSARCSNE